MSMDVSQISMQHKVPEDAEIPLSEAVNQYKYIGFYFTGHSSTPCLIWNDVIKQLKKEINAGNRMELLCIMVPISTIDLEQIELQ